MTNPLIKLYHAHTHTTPTAHLEKDIVDSDKFLRFCSLGSRLWVLHGVQQVEVPVNGASQLEVSEVVQELFQSVHVDFSLLKTLLFLGHFLSFVYT